MGVEPVMVGVVEARCQATTLRVPSLMDALPPDPKKELNRPSKEVW